MVDLHLDGVTRRYGDTTAVDDVSVDVAEGEFFTLVGPSGCGKTTTLRTVAGFERPDEGRVRFGDRDVTDLPPEEREVGVVFQSYALFPHMTVRENVAYGLRFRDPPGGVSDDERVRELLDLVDLAGFGDRDPGELSGGQQQRVALARALAPGPRLLLLDEPMSALDARLRERLRRQVKRVQSDLDITTVYVTHDQEEALAVSDRVAVMHDGRVEQVGTPQEVYREPATEFVAGFVGENNLFRGTVRAVDGDAATVDVGDATLTIRADASLSTGERVTVAVRPERVNVGADTNRLDLTVTDHEFLGGTVRVHGTWAGREVVVRTDDVPDATVLTVGFDPADAHVVGRPSTDERRRRPVDDAPLDG